MIETFTALLTAHLIADFILQTEWLITRKDKWLYLLLHVAIVGAIAAIAIGIKSRLAGEMIAIITITHLAMDYVKVHWLRDSWKAFVTDQLVHIAVIAGISYWVPTLASLGFWSCLSGDAQAQLYAAMTLASGIIGAVPLGGILIKKLVQEISPTNTAVTPAPAAATASTATTSSPHPAAAAPAPVATPAAAPLPPSPTLATTGSNASNTSSALKGMERGGKYIGWLERGLTLLFVMTGKIEGVGFLLAAKSILRFGDVRNDTERHQQEYIIIGTMLSFGWGLGVAMITAAALRYWGFA